MWASRCSSGAARALARDVYGSGKRYGTSQRVSYGKDASRFVIAIGALSGFSIGFMYSRPLRLDSHVDEDTEDDKTLGVRLTQVTSPSAGHARATVSSGSTRFDDGERYLTLSEVAAHSLAHDAWVIVDGKVYDVTGFHPKHPGGSSVIVANAGRDVTELFRSIHPPNTIEDNLPRQCFKGYVDPAEVEESLKAYQAEQERLEAARRDLPNVETMLGLDELEDAARSFLGERVVNYYSGYSLDGFSRADNRSAFRKCRLLPRVMIDVTTVKPQTTLFGIPSALPIYVSPASNALLGHPDGELNITRGAAKTGIIQGVSAASSYPLKDLLEEKHRIDTTSNRELGMVYQVYVHPDRTKCEDLIREAVAGGCQALMLTVDSNTGDFRQTTEKLKGTRGSADPGVKMDPFVSTDTWHDPALNWNDLVWLKEFAGDLPVYLKGVCHIEDVRLAKKHGMAGCILSNHGGRQLDTARTGFDSLREIYAEDPDLCRQTELYVDGGCRRGSEVLMAVAMGAKGVGLGRPFLWAQAAYGEKGVIRAVRIMEREIVTAMRLLGVRSLDEIKPGMIQCLQELWK